MNRWKKLMGLCRHPGFIPPLIRHRIAGGIEHYAMVKHLAPATLIDAGANKGQFSLLVRKLFPKTRIIAFEPLPESADRYERLFGDDKLTTLHRLALDVSSGERTFYVANRGDSSSLLRPAQGLQMAFGGTLSHEISVETVRLDSVIDAKDLPAPVLLKIDVQGAEKQVILSATKLLDYIDHIYVEILFADLYDGQSRFRDVFHELDAKGYRMRGVFNQVITSEYNATYADVLFTRDLQH
ncbi:MAG: FkbM family methyltransferase [Bacteroidetes bacterium SB0662_bin_6]|nr:FkbM family methyltransferase [Bacteroidetes bacterium SB0668_bin_1]MYE04223.1 FkbM family methyltransferase [Bacteroidetes bacterium SB0662_bin_6]